MSSQTLLERALETELGRAGLPFLTREIYQKEVYKDWMGALDFSSREIAAMPTPQRKYIEHHQEILDWDRRLVHRETALNSSQRYVAYDVLRTPANEAAFKVARTTDYDALLDRIIESRAFYCELVRIADLGGPSEVEMAAEQSDETHDLLAIMGTDIGTFGANFDYFVRRSQAEMHVDLRLLKRAAFFDGSVNLAHKHSRTILWVEVMGEGAVGDPPFYSLREDCRHSGLMQLLPPLSVEALAAGVADFVRHRR